MKYIQKGKEPASLTAWKKVQKINGLIPEYGDLRGKEKKDLHDSLLADQGYICCYCGVQVSQENSHIEHLPSQAYFRLNNDPNGTTDYQHLLASCGISEQWRKDKYEKEWTEKKFEELTSSSDRCGIKRGNQPVAISPLQVDCEAFFRYDASNGAIRAEEGFDQSEAASATIAILNLGTKKLEDLRKAAIDTAILISEELTEEELLKLFKKKNRRGEFIPFCSAIAYILKM